MSWSNLKHNESYRIGKGKCEYYEYEAKVKEVSLEKGFIFERSSS